MTNFIGAPGLNTFHAAGWTPGGGIDVDGFNTAIRAFYEAIKGSIVGSVTVNYPLEVTEHDELTGELVDVHTAAALEPTVGTGPGGENPRSSAIVCALNTSDIRPATDYSKAHRLQGRHFIGPVPTQVFANNGQVLGTVAGATAAAYGGMIDWPGLNLHVWGQPHKNGAGDSLRDGKLGRVGSVTVRLTPGTLRSRKI